MSEPRTVYLIDGTSQLFRAYFAIRGLSNEDGTPTNAVFGFTSMLRKLLADESPEYVAVAWDLPGPTFRHERFEAYKANRPEAPEDLHVQVPLAKRVCEVFGIPSLERAGYEADDLIATFVRAARERGFRAVVVASDKDLLQLVGDGVDSLNPSKDLRLDAEGVRREFGVPPDRVVDVLGLMGDAVDNIPGVPGVGEKTAKAAVALYGGMDAVLERAGRFRTAYGSRDEALAAIEAAEKGEASGVESAASRLERAAAALRSLVEVEADEELAARYAQAIESVEAVGLDDLRRGVDADGKALRKRFRDVKRSLKALDRGSSRKIWEAIDLHRDQASLSRELAVLADDAPVAFDEDALRLGAPDREAAADLFRELGFRRLTEEFSSGADDPHSTAADASERADGEEVPREYRTLLTREDLESFLEVCRQAGKVAVDTETDSVDPMRARLVGISLSPHPGLAAYVPVGHRYLGVPVQLPLETVREVLGPSLDDVSLSKVGHNLKYDDHVLRRHGLSVRGWTMDTMVAAFVLDSSRTSYKMDALAEDLLGRRTISYADVAGSGKNRRTLDAVDVERVSEYAAEDADVTIHLAGTIAERLRAEGLEEVYRSIDHPVLPVLVEMEAHGIAVDRKLLAAMSRDMAERIDRLRSEIHELAGVEFNLDSPKQLREVLFERLSLRPGRKTAKGKVHSTDARTLEELAAEHPVAGKILQYRELAKLKSTYVDALPQLIHPETGRIHTSFHPTGAATGRLSSSDPNLQNIPARTEVGRGIRRAFVAEPGWTFVAADYSQIELRVLAHLCGDPELLRAFRAGEDIHRVTAARVAGVEPGQVTQDMRRAAKAVNFGILYGMSESRLAREQGMTRQEASDFIASYFERFSAVRDYIERVREDARRDGLVRTMFGRVRPFPQLHGRIGRAQQEQALRAAVNTTIQGTAADLMKLAMVAVRDALARAGSRARMLLQVHDELLLESPVDEADAIVETVRGAMETVHPMEVPLSVDTAVGADWEAVT